MPADNRTSSHRWRHVTRLLEGCGLAGWLWRWLCRGQEGSFQAPVFVVGCGHSGTTLMLALLDNHPNIWAVPDETAVLLAPVWEKLRRFREFEVQARQAGARRWAEKTPRHVRQLRTAFRYFPRARVLYMLRDGRDVACSLRNRGWDLRQAALRWLKDNRQGEPHWGSPSVHVVRYEALVQEPETTMSGVCRFLGEEYFEGMLQLEGTTRSWYAGTSQPGTHREKRLQQIQRPLFNRGARWIREMSVEDKHLFKEIAGSMLVRYDYVQDASW